MSGLKMFGPIWAASGLMNFFGQGWPFHKLLKWFGLCLKGLTFVSKTTTDAPREGNMPFDPKTLMPKERFPKCVVCGPRQWFYGVALNAVGLSGPGAKDLLGRGLWQKRTEPFMISFMSVGETASDRLQEWQDFLLLLGKYYSTFDTLFGVQLNISCPNTSLRSIRPDLVREAFGMLDAASKFRDMPILVKVSVTMSPKDARDIGDHRYCAGIVVSNTIPLGWAGISAKKWKRWFGSNHISPLRIRGISADGGLSGKPLLSLVEEWVKRLRALGFSKHINAGGGILWPSDVDRLFKAGADSISYGSGSFLRPFCSWFIIRRAYKLFKEREERR